VSQSASISFTVPGRLKGKGRPKFSTRGGFARAYTPAETANAEAMVRSLAAVAMRGIALLEGPCALHVHIWLQPPASWPKKKRAMASFVTGKPDCDNVVKLIGDALNGIVWRDDSQVAELKMSRHYRLDGGECAKVTIVDLSKSASEPALRIAPLFADRSAAA